MKGTVKWFNNKRGYGFITTEEGKDVFVHYSAIKSEHKYRMLVQDQKVEFDIVQGEKGDQAANVVPKTFPPKPERKKEDRPKAKTAEKPKVEEKPKEE